MRNDSPHLSPKVHLNFQNIMPKHKLSSEMGLLNTLQGEMPAEVLEGYKTDSSGLKEFLDYHTASPKTCKCDFEDNKLMKSGIEGKKLR